MGWKGFGGDPGTDLHGLGWYGSSGMGMRVGGGWQEPGTGVDSL